MASSINASTSGAGGVITTADASGILNIQTAGTTAIAIDSAGRITMPLQPKFFGYRNAGNVAATNTILHNNVLTNVGSCYNAATGVFTAPVAGYYEIHMGCHAENSQPIKVMIYKNGSALVGEYTNGTNYGAISTTAIVLLAANDQITNVVTAGTVWGGDETGIRMSVKLIG